MEQKADCDDHGKEGRMSKKQNKATIKPHERARIVITYWRKGAKETCSADLRFVEQAVMRENPLCTPSVHCEVSADGGETWEQFE